MKINAKKVCLECEMEVIGRVDKKFCCDKCRTAYNNRQHLEADQILQRAINRALRQNRRILKSLNGSGSTLVSKSILMSCGFEFGYVTRYTICEDGKTYFYCYDQGYIVVNENEYLLVSDMQESGIERN